LDPFGEIMIEDIFVIELKNDTVFSVRIESNEDIIDNISYRVENNRLVLNDNNSYKWLPDYPLAKLTISFPDISDININAPAKMFSKDTLTVDSLSLSAGAQLIDLDLIVNAKHIYLWTGSDNYGHYTLRGYTKSSDLRIYGSAQLYAGELKTEYAWVRNYSIGDCYVYAEKQLRVWLKHYGNIYYYGTPEEIIIEQKDSRGRLIPGGTD